MTNRALHVVGLAALVLLIVACGKSSPKAAAKSTSTVTTVSVVGPAKTTAPLGPNQRLCGTAAFYLGSGVQDGAKWHELAVDGSAARASASVIAATNQVGAALDKKDTVGTQSAAKILLAACKAIGVGS